MLITRDMKVTTLLSVIFSTWIGLVGAEEKLDLRSVLLQIFNKVKTNPNGDALTGINLATSPEVITPDRNNEIPNLFSNNNGAADDTGSDQTSIINEAIEEINAEIDSLKAKYVNELNNIGGYKETDAVVQNSENDANGVVKHSWNGPEQDYDSLIRKMNAAAKDLLLIRMKLATEFGITETDSNRGKDVGALQDNGQILEQTKNNLKLILLNALQNGDQNALTKTESKGDTKTGLDSMDQLIGGDLMETPLEERNFHSKRCSMFRGKCGGWNSMCCQFGVVKQKKKVPMCCRFLKVKGIESLSGVCLPNPFGNRECAK